ARAQHLCPAREPARVVLLGHRVGGDRLPEARPTGARIEFRFRREQRLAAADAFIDARVLGRVILAAERALRAVIARDVVLLARELLLPLGVGLDDLVHGSPDILP